MSSEDTNPFDDVNGTFFALRNAQGQYSLWPQFVTVPQGWTIEAGPDSHAAMIAFIEEKWGPYLRPKKRATA